MKSQEQVPPGATRHAFSIKLMRRVFFTDTARWNGIVWQEVGCTHGYSTPLDEEPYFKKTPYLNHYISAIGGDIYSKGRYKGD